MATVSPVADALIRPQVPEGAEKWQYLVVPLQEAKDSRRPTIRGHPTSSTTSVGRVGKPSACRSSTATSWPGQSCCSSDRSTDLNALGRDRGEPTDPAIPSTPSRSPASKDEGFLPRAAECFRAMPGRAARRHGRPSGGFPYWFLNGDLAMATHVWEGIRQAVPDKGAGGVTRATRPVEVPPTCRQLRVQPGELELRAALSAGGRRLSLVLWRALVLNEPAVLELEPAGARNTRP